MKYAAIAWLMAGSYLLGALYEGIRPCNQSTIVAAAITIAGIVAAVGYAMFEILA